VVLAGAETASGAGGANPRTFGEDQLDAAGDRVDIVGTTDPAYAFAALEPTRTVLLVFRAARTSAATAAAYRTVAGSIPLRFERTPLSERQVQILRQLFVTQHDAMLRAGTDVSAFAYDQLADDQVTVTYVLYWRGKPPTPEMRHWFDIFGPNTVTWDPGGAGEL
jgi:hypothetical protein